MASPSAVREWCRVTCADYPGVEIRDMSASFRDGLAFCAIIHKHRPDLIDFSSLSRDNAYQNNQLALEVADRTLGIPVLLGVRDVVCCKTPDSLSIITFVYQFYSFFSSKSHGPAGLKSAHSFTQTKSRDGFKPPPSSSHLESSKDPSSSPSAVTVCQLCFKPVHLIQRHLVDGQIHHRSCFRCKLCHCTLLPGFYTQETEAGPLICQYHITDSKRTGSSQNNHRCKVQTGFVSLSGLAISSVPHYTMKTASQDPLRENSTVGLKSSVQKPEPLHPSPAGGRDGTAEGAEVAGPAPSAGDIGPKQEVTESQRKGSRPVPAPRRSLDSSVPVPAPRVKPSQTSSSCPAAENESNPRPSPLSPPPLSATAQPRVKPSHPWLGIIHPGPWTQLPPAPAPVARSNLVRPREAPPNPFAEEVEEETCEKADAHPAAGSTTTGPQSCPLPRSVSVPTATPPTSHDSLEPEGQTDANQSAPSCQNPQDCQNNSYNSKEAVPRSKTFQALPSQRAPAPGHGFPLIKRKVQTDQTVATGDLQEEMGELNKQLEALEQRGVELEKNLRHGKNLSLRDEETMLTEWFSLIHQRHVLVCRDTELVFLRKQQKLEERQADVEYDLRCLLSKPESDWSQEDRNREQQLMGELVRIIEQRNQIISSLDQDRLRERSEEVMLETMMKNKDLQKEGLKEFKKSKGKLKPLKVFKMLTHKAETSQNSVEKKS